MKDLVSNDLWRAIRRAGRERQLNTLCIWPVAPDPTGDGASQRAWHVLHAVAKVSTVDLVLLFQADRPELESVSLAPARQLARSVRVIRVPEWATSLAFMPALPSAIGRVLDLARITSVEAPRLPRAALERIAAQLPGHVDRLLVGRLSTACIVDDLCRMGLLSAERRIVDFDDVMSRFRRVQLRSRGSRLSMVQHHWHSFVANLLEAAETRMARSWTACTVACEDDVRLLKSAYPGARISHLPNIVDRAALPEPRDGPLRLLFVGNLAYPPNADGIAFFLDQVWPRLRRSNPEVTMDVVGRAPADDLVAKIMDADVRLHIDAPDVEPFYQAAHVVVAPIFFGGGTRIKVLEAMAYARPIVATSFGVEGLAMADGVHALLADTPDEMAAAIGTLAKAPDLRRELARAAKNLQLQRYGSGALDVAVATMLQLPAGQGRRSPALPVARSSGVLVGALAMAERRDRYA